MKNNRRVQLHFIPASSSWLNLVERFFGLLAEKTLRRGVFTSVKELEEKIHEFIQARHAEPKPFKWTKSVGMVLEKVERAKQILLHTQV